MEPKLQKPIIYNEFLPYYHSTLERGRQQLEEIKSNLSLSIQKHELWPGALYWTNRLKSFVRVYGLSFSKEEHLSLIWLLYELVTMDNLESPLLYTWSSLLAKLLKKLKVISREELCLPWRPLHELCQRVFDSKYSSWGMKIYPQRTCSAVLVMIHSARSYFSIESTKEMLEEWLPLLCPFDMSAIDGTRYLSDFLPTHLPPDSHEHGFKLWFEKLISFWLDINNSSSTEEPLIKLFVRVACHCIGYIDWTPYIDKIFSRILRSFNLPVGRKEFHSKPGKPDCFSPRQAALLIVAMMDGRTEVVQEHISRLMKALESYYHPSNVSMHTKALLTFLKELACVLITRLKSERFSKPVWYSEIPAQAKLTEKCLDVFVKSLLPCLKLAMFSKFGTTDASTAFHRLSLIRSELVLPDLLETTYKALETVNEPHQVTATLQCVSAVSQALLGGDRFPEGRKHLFSLLMLALPGIDANDFRKTILSGLLISSLISLVPLVDCSLAADSGIYSEEEKEICFMTSQFEDFVLQFLDRCFGLIDDTRLEQVSVLDRMVSGNSQAFNQESLMGLGLSGCVQVIFSQCSPQLFKTSLEKLGRFATGRVFESEVAGRMCADMCSAAAKVNPALTLQTFLPHCFRTIDSILSDEDSDQHEAEHPDHELLWSLQLLSKVVQNVGDPILPYQDQLIDTLQKCVHLKSKTGSEHASRALSNVLVSLSTTYPMEARSTSSAFSAPPSEHNYIKDWAVPGDMHNLGIEWHIPSSSELLLVDRLLSIFLQPEVARLEEFISGKDMERESLHQSLNLIAGIITGVSAYLPDITGAQVEGCPTSLVDKADHQYSMEYVKAPPQQFERQQLLNFIHKLSGHLLDTCSDDTKSMFILIRITKSLLTNFGSSNIAYEGKRHAFLISKSALMNKLKGKRFDLRPMMIARAQLQHELCLVERVMVVMTATHLTALTDLVKLSISSYAEVRVRAQRALVEALDIYLYSSRMILPHILPCLESSPAISHDQFKGALHLMMQPAVIGVVVHDWKSLKNTIPIVVKADHSEKPSILNLMSRLVKMLVNGYEYFALTYKVTEVCVQRAIDLSGQAAPPQEVLEGQQLALATTQESIRHYTELVDELVSLQNQKLQWRHSEMSVRFLALLIRHDHPFPTSGTRVIVHYLTHDLLAIRKLSLWGLPIILQQQKRDVVKIPVDIRGQQGSSTGDTPGERNGIKWLCYDPDRVPKSSEEWDRFPFVDKTHWGYYTWPKTLLTHAPTRDQPVRTRPKHQLSESELVIYECFSSEEFVEKLVKFLSLEEVKGKDRYDFRKRLLFKLLFRNFGDSFLPLLVPHLEKLVADSQDSSQRCASEIIAGIVTGSKNWPFEMVQSMQATVERLIAKVLEELTSETVHDWLACLTDISANRDPHRLHWLFAILTKDPLGGNNGSFKDASRLCMLQSLLAQQEWRVPGLLHQVILYLENHFTHSFKNVRDTIGSLLSQALVCDTRGFPALLNPRKADLVAKFLPQLPTLTQAVALTGNEEMARLSKTVLMYCYSTYDISCTENFKLLVKLLPLITVEDGEIAPLVIKVCSLMSHANLGGISTDVFTIIKEGLVCELWKVRVLTLQVLQALVFQNLYFFTDSSLLVTDELLKLFEDVQAEVREQAAACISGFVRCGFISSVAKLKGLFVEKSRCSLPVKGVKSGVADTGNSKYEKCLVRRQTGVIGLAALVEACPYSVPAWLPDVVEELANHLHDPVSIRSTVKRALSEFRRTHYDNWSEHKQKFSDDQLSILTDLLISPSYYA